MIVPDVALRLYALPPPRFVSERNALATALAAKGDPAAASVRKLPRPVGLAWVLNRLARERPREVQALLEAGDELRAGQRRALAGKGPEELRAAEEELRARARALRGAAEAILTEAGRRAPPGDLARIELLLRVAASVPGPTGEALRRGTLEREPEVAGGDLSGFEVLAGGAARSPAGPRRGSEGAPSARGRQERKARERAAEKARAEEQREERLERERARALAKRDLERATRQVRLAEEAAQRAEEHARAARARAEEARRNARQRQQALRALGPPTE